MRAIHLSVALAIALSGAAQQQPLRTIDILADVRDPSRKVPAGLTAKDFTVLEDGIERKVTAVDYLDPATRADWQIVVYFETQLSSGSNRESVAKALTRYADQLVRMGEVDIVVADPTPDALLRASRDANAVRETLRKVAALSGSNWLVTHRRDFYQSVQMGISPTGAATVPSNAVVPQVDEEIGIIGRFQHGIESWLSRYRRRGPRALLLVTDGFDLDPVDFYAFTLTSQQQDRVRTYVQRSQFAASIDNLAHAIAAGGWTTLAIPGDSSAGAGWFQDASVSGTGIRALSGMSNQPMPPAFLVRPLEPLRGIADATGGTLVPNYTKIDDAMDGLQQRVRITYAVDRAPDGKVRSLEIRPRRNDVKVRSMRWTATATPDEMAQARAAVLLENESTPDGGLQVTSFVKWAGEGQQRTAMIYGDAKLDPIRAALPEGSLASFRVTTAIEVPGNPDIVVTRLVPNVSRSVPAFSFQMPAKIPPEATRLVVTIEEISTDLWGAAHVTLR